MASLFMKILFTILLIIISGLTDEEIKYDFQKRISRQVKDLLQDIKSIS